MVYASPFKPTPFFASFDRLAERTIAPSRFAQVVARLGAWHLDRRLIAGADPTGSPLLAARACRLTSPANRANLADSVGRLLQRGTHPYHRAAVVPYRPAIERNADELRGFASSLNSGVPLYAQGIAMLGRLLADGAGPLYVGPPEMLARRLGEVQIALNG